MLIISIIFGLEIASNNENLQLDMNSEVVLFIEINVGIQLQTKTTIAAYVK